MAKPRRRGDVPTTRRKDGRLVAVIGWTDELDRTQRTYIYGRTQAEVNDKHAAIVRRLADGMTATDSPGRLDTFASAWLKSTLPASDRKMSTKTLYASLTRSHILGSDLGTMPLRSVKPRHVEAWVTGLRSKGLRPSTVRQIYTVLRAILDTAVRDDLLARNPAAALTRPKVEKREAAYLVPDQIRTLLAAAEGSRYAALFALLVNTGLRRGEALALHWTDIDLEDRVLRVRGTLSRVDGNLVVTTTKTERSRRSVPLSSAAVEILRGVRARQRAERLHAGSQWVQTPFVFTTELGEPCDPRNALRALKAASAKAGLPGIGLHTLRHSSASVMIVNGVPLKVVSEILGHASIAITGDVYGHVSPDVSREALDRLSAALV